MFYFYLTTILESAPPFDELNLETKELLEYGFENRTHFIYEKILNEIYNTTLEEVNKIPF